MLVNFTLKTSKEGSSLLEQGKRPYILLTGIPNFNLHVSSKIVPNLAISVENDCWDDELAGLQPEQDDQAALKENPVRFMIW